MIDVYVETNKSRETRDEQIDRESAKSTCKPEGTLWCGVPSIANTILLSLMRFHVISQCTPINAHLFLHVVGCYHSI